MANAKMLAEKWIVPTGIPPYLSHKKMLRKKEWYTISMIHPVSNLIRQPAIGLQLALLREVVGNLAQRLQAIDGYPPGITSSDDFQHFHTRVTH